MAPRLKERYLGEVRGSLMERFGIGNVHAAPKLTKIVVNMGVTLGLLPTKGLTLPLLSYGGTSLLLNMASIGILMNISASKNR